MGHERRVFVNGPLELDQIVPLELEDAHHLVSVLRLSENDEVIVVDHATKQEFKAHIVRASTAEPCLRISGSLPVRKVTTAVFTLSFALCKGDTNDFVCEKATELGVDSILFWQAERSVVRISSENDAEKKVRRWRKISESAGKQSGRVDLPRIQLIKNTQELISTVNGYRSPTDRLFLCSLRKEALPLKYLSPVTSKAHLFIGPEGDLSQREEEELTQMGCEFMSLGPLRLRSETAAITAVAVVNALSSLSLHF